MLSSENKTKKKNKAFTLIEVITYLALFGIIFLAVVEYMFATVQSNQVAEQRQNIESSVIFINNHLKEKFRSSQTVDLINSTFDQDSGKLVITSGASNFTYRLDQSLLKFNDGATESVISNQGVKMTQFKVEKLLTTTGETIGVRVSLGLESEKNTRLVRNISTSYLLKN